MRLKFTELVLCEFKSFRGKHTLRLDLAPGLHFVRGRNMDERALETNGVGKTTLWDAFVWCLFGRTTKGLRNPDILPWSGRKGTRATLRFLIDGVAHRVTRTASPNTLQIDGEDAGPEAVVKLIGMSYELVTSTIIMGQGCPLFFDVTAGAKMQLLSDVLGLERWDERTKKATERVRSLEAEHAELSSAIAARKTMLAETHASMAELKPKANAWDETYEKRREEVEALARKLAPQIAALDKEVAGLDLKYDGAATEARACARSAAKLGDECSAAAVALERVKSGYWAAVKQLVQLEREIKNLATVDRCPTCGGLLKYNALDEHIAELERKRASLDRSSAMINLRPYKRTLETLQSRKEHELRYLESFTAKADGALREFNQKKAQLIALQEQERQTRKAFDETERNPYTAQIQALTKRKRKHEAAMGDLEEDLRSCARELERAKFWPKGFKDVKLHIVEELLQELELATMGLLEEVGLVGWEVKYAIERESRSGKVQRGLAVMVGSPRSKGRLVHWESWSGGESQRLRVVGALALSSVLLNRAGVRPNIEVLDEPTKFMSAGGVSDLCASLSERAEGHNLRIFYCDHQRMDAGASGNVSTITIERDHKGSWIDQERV